ncbi:MAG: 1-deoxy-D-xylulose-5-phosphate reductoisomerase, partial [Sphaerochaetaceae bacterium]|nr:1-deoxy-D-xylulose-5-phosphate reductoisomerase [Sphaerochaetaceae bacterium]
MVILGATGSIGTTCLNYLRNSNPGFLLVGATAKRSREKLESIGKEFNCPVLLTDPIETSSLSSFLLSPKPDIVLNAVSGADGLFASVTAIDCGIDLALSNKESVVMGGSWIFSYAEKKNVKIIPVDSEHSAIYNLLKGHEAQSLVITASGGPFVDRMDLDNVTVSEALNHPTWKMGKKITIDSATLANKGLEVIEASFLFDMEAKDIEVTVHRQSIVHSLIRTKEGAVYAQLSPPDMTLPIVSALSDGKIELEKVVRPLSFSDLT